MSIRETFERRFSTAATSLDDRLRFIPDVRLIPGLLVIFIVLGGSLTTMFLYTFMKDPLAGNFTITFQYYQRFIGEPLYHQIMLDSLVIALKTTIGTLILGYPLAYYIAMKSGHRNVMLLLVIVPIWTNEVIRTYAWVLILNANGLVNWILVDVLGVISSPLQLMNTQNAVVLGLVHPLLPYMIVPIVASLISIDYSEVEAAKNLGATNLQAFYEVTLPQTKTGIIAGSTFVFVLSSGAYLAPELLGGTENNMIANFIGLMFGLGQNWNFGAVLAVVYSLLIVALFAFVGLVMGVDFSGTTTVESGGN